MEICSSTHEEIVHDDAYGGCPMCELLARRDSYTRDIQSLVNQLNTVLEEDIANTLAERPVNDTVEIHDVKRWLKKLSIIRQDMDAVKWEDE